jgi:aspartyl-tRNA(Asn)/glutamyl-tRNA(Gln) amidotransferase subunit A
MRRGRGTEDGESSATSSVCAKQEATTLLDVITGRDKSDAATRVEDDNSSYASATDSDVAGLTIGVPSELVEGAADGVVEVFRAALDELEAKGASITDVSLPSLEHAVAAYYVIAMSEASSNLARYDGVRYGVSGGYDGDWNETFAAARETGFGPEVKRRILLGTYALSAGYHDKYYAQAQNARALVKQDFDAALTEADVLASPTMPVSPFELGESLDDPLQMYLADANTVPVNLANLPAISVPAGTDEALVRLHPCRVLSIRSNSCSADRDGLFRESALGTATASIKNGTVASASFSGDDTKGR